MVHYDTPHHYRPRRVHYKENHLIEQTVKMVARTPRLTRRRTEELLIDFYTEPDAARRDELRNRIVEGNLRLVIWYTKRHWHQLGWMDRFQEAAYGLMLAVEKWRPGFDAAFSTYAFYWLRQAVTRATYNTAAVVREPVGIHERRRKLRKFRREFYAEHGRSPDSEELSKGTQTTAAHRVRARTRRFVYWADAVGLGRRDATAPSNDSTPGPWYDPRPSVLDAIDTDMVKSIAHSVLDVREFDVIARRFGFVGTGDGRTFMNRDGGETLEDIGERWGVTRERIRQIEEAALRKLRGVDWSNKRGGMSRPYSERKAEMDKQTVRQMALTVAIVGGIPDKKRRSIAPKLEAIGFKVIAAVGGSEKATRIPPTAAYVIALVDSMEHGPYYEARDRAKEIGARFVSGSRHWAKTRDVLIAEGILSEQGRLIPAVPSLAVVSGSREFEHKVAAALADDDTEFPDGYVKAELVDCQHTWRKSKTASRRYRCTRPDCLVLADGMKLRGETVLGILKCQWDDCQDPATWQGKRPDGDTVYACMAHKHHAQPASPKPAPMPAAVAAAVIAKPVPEPKATETSPQEVLTVKPKEETVTTPQPKQKLDIHATIAEIIDLLD